MTNCSSTCQEAKIQTVSVKCGLELLNLRVKCGPQELGRAPNGMVRECMESRQTPGMNGRS
eukprot:4887189-Amphidinium_carterae.1